MKLINAKNIGKLKLTIQSALQCSYSFTHPMSWVEARALLVGAGQAYLQASIAVLGKAPLGQRTLHKRRMGVLLKTTELK